MNAACTQFLFHLDISQISGSIVAALCKLDTANSTLRFTLRYPSVCAAPRRLFASR